MRTISATILLLFVSCSSSEMTIPPCGSIKKEKDGSELRTKCDESYIWVSEFLKGKQDGIERYYTPSRKLKSESNYVDGNEHGQSLIWDTTGFLSAKRFFHNGTQVGGDTGWFANGKVRRVAHYDSTGTPDGYWYQRYDEGNLRYEQHWTAGACTSHVEYYRNGKVRIRMSSPISSKDALFGKAVTTAESYTWSGKLIEKVVNGNGKVYLLPKDFNDFRFEYDSEKPVVGFIEVYKDTDLVKVHQIDSAAILKYR